MTTVIRPARPTDHEAIDATVRRAFGDEGAAVATMVREIRHGEFALPAYEFVAEEDGQVIGHVCLTGTTLHGADGSTQIITMLSPLSVEPGRQGGGIGSALVRQVLQTAADNAVPFVVLEGSPAYYRRFGFTPAAAVGIVLPIPDWAPPEAAQIAVLDPGATVPAGRVEYPAYVP
ncbi:GNAT family N-acetyltransferase [Branchiibius sp. NY16-3462-2]|uniref:GNAT family N-acetyltransferase n=1 Tax=Branchiibius sp. NY16-3462-2 TaxID=1807500 RepID=UPI00079B4497|nr:N-acetyltransferase [Branchiibius sp. NY16-3462-2]KYH44371.1 hypothetical protein AZH51_07500 [Branchiibius sp. NY16-3462-2]